MLIDNLKCFNKVKLANGVVTDYGYLYSDSFLNDGYRYNSDFGEYIENPYINLNKLNNNWLDPKYILSDMQGWKNQEIILKEQGKIGNFACQECYINGGNNISWYLPSIGELGIMFAKLKTINNVIFSSIKNKMVIGKNHYYWSST